MTEQTADIEIQLLLQGLHLKYGYDFRGYSRESLKRRVLTALARSGCHTISQMLERVLYDPVFSRTLISDLTVNVTEMFRDPEVYLYIRRKIVPVLKTYPSIRIWHAGCSTGEEMYSMAILLKEEGLYDKALLYGTDISGKVLDVGREGVYSKELTREYTSNYENAGGRGSLSSYYEESRGFMKMDENLKKNMVFSLHNLATDETFSEVHMVFCRNVLIYFERSLQQRALDLFHRSLVRWGYLCLGKKESVEYSSTTPCFEVVDRHEKIYKKI